MRAWLAVAGVLVLAAVLFGRLSSAPLPVQAAPVRRGRVEETVSSTRAGTLKAKVQVTLSAEAAGRVLELRRRDGERVSKGEPICLLDPSEACAQAQTRLGLDRAALQVAEVQRARCSLLAPFDGVITETFVEPGQWVLPGSRVCGFMDDSDLRVEAEVDEIDSARLKAGQRVHLSVDALPGKPFEGILSSI